MAWYEKIRKGLKPQSRRDIPDGLWVKCDGCDQIMHKAQLSRNLWVCPRCEYHFRIPSRTYLKLLLDEGSFQETFAAMESTDPLKFQDSKKYTDRLKRGQDKTNQRDAAITGVGTIGGRPVSIGALEFAFMGGSMGSVVGEKITRCINRGVEERMPVVTITASGGARMQEGILSLMQMAKSSSALARLGAEKVPFVSILTNPSTAGVMASFASLGDVIVAEPKALLGFAGPRVIEQTIGEELPAGFQRSEFFLEHGMVDMVVSRHDLRQCLVSLFDLLLGAGTAET
jgi:acetyl-CoA carboxylase carboxyl transferase subunit beta